MALFMRVGAPRFPAGYIIEIKYPPGAEWYMYGILNNG
jgi:hypothetical protein